MELVQIAKGTAVTAPSPRSDRKPPWLRVRAPGGSNYAEIRKLMRGLNLLIVWLAHLIYGIYYDPGRENA